MVKFNRRDKKLKDFDMILEEITQYQNACSDDEISVESLEYEVFSESGDTLEEESNYSSDDEDIDFSPGQSINISCGRTFYENSEDFPQETSEYEVQFTKEQLESLNLVDRKEYKDQRNILNPIRKPKNTQKRCQNYDE